MKSNDGGPAFLNITPDMLVDGGPGMSLRDWFAGQALKGLLDYISVDDWINGVMKESTVVNYAHTAYRFAGAMLAERAK